MSAALQQLPPGITEELQALFWQLKDFEASGDTDPDAVAQRVSGGRSECLRNRGCVAVRWTCKRQLQSNAACKLFRLGGSCRFELALTGPRRTHPIPQYMELSERMARLSEAVDDQEQQQASRLQQQQALQAQQRQLQQAAATSSSNGGSGGSGGSSGGGSRFIGPLPPPPQPAWQQARQQQGPRSMATR